MTFMITGGTGIIGSRIVRYLVQDGNRIVVYDLFPNIEDE